MSQIEQYDQRIARNNRRPVIDSVPIRNIHMDSQEIRSRFLMAEINDA